VAISLAELTRSPRRFAPRDDTEIIAFFANLFELIAYYGCTIAKNENAILNYS
jgi:hypothetical protein